MAIGKLLERVIKQKNISIGNLAEGTGIPVQTIYSMIRRDSMKTNMNDLHKISRYLEISLDYFCQDSESELPQTQKIPALSKTALEIAQAYEQASPKNQNIIRQLLDL